MFGPVFWTIMLPRTAATEVTMSYRLSALLAALSLAPFLALADDMPPIRPGLWEVRLGDDGRAGGTIRQCIDGPTFREVLQAGQRMMGSACSPLMLGRSGHGYTASVRCVIGPSTMDSQSELTGDFQTSYQSITHTRFTPPLMGQGTSQVVSNGRFVGPCGPDLKPGDMMMADGRKMNVLTTMRQTPDVSRMMTDIDKLMTVLSPPPRR